MAPKSKKVKSPKAVPATTPAPVETPVAAAVESTGRLPRVEARAANFARTLGAQAAPVVLTTKGSNPGRSRVYGYANGSQGGGVPQGAAVEINKSFTTVPKGVNGAQWQLLCQLANGSTPVANLYTQGVTPRTVRRAFRAGAITFVNVA